MPETQTNTTKPETTTSKPSQPRRLSEVVGSRNPDNDAILEEIEGSETLVASAESEQRQGKRRKYWLTKVTLADGRSFSVAGKAVAEPFSYLSAEDFPIAVVFYREPSDFEPGASYWAVK